MHAVHVNSGGKQVGVVRQPHGGQIAAVGSAPQADFLRVYVSQCLEIFSCRNDIFVFGAAARAAIVWLAEVAAIHDAGPIVDRQHDISTARQILIHGIGIVVVVHVVEAEHHLADGAAVNEDQRGTPAASVRFGRLRFEQLSVNFPAVGGFEDYLLRRYQLGGGKIGWQRGSSDQVTASRGNDVRHRGTCGG